MSETKEFAQAIAYALSEYFLQIAGDDYRELYVERKAHLTAISELEKQLGDANDRIAELEYNAANDASSIHAIITLLDINDEMPEVIEDMYKTAHNLAYKLRNRVAELKELIDRLIDAGNDIVEEYWSDALNLDEIKKIELWLTLVNNWKESDK